PASSVPGLQEGLDAFSASRGETAMEAGAPPTFMQSSFVDTNDMSATQLALKALNDLMHPEGDGDASTGKEVGAVADLSADKTQVDPSSAPDGVVPSSADETGFGVAQSGMVG
ncbi:unnamed protein product, partial [Amoebophrya sp. A25]